MGTEGCWKCFNHSYGSHADFCGCDCHDDVRELAARRSAAARLARDLLGSKAMGPFRDLDVGRLSDGTINRIEIVVPWLPSR